MLKQSKMDDPYPYRQFFTIVTTHKKYILTSSTSVSTIYNCSMERAFKTPILCDIAKVHTGFGIMPRITHCTNDENWGQSGCHKNVFAAKSRIHKAGFISVDKVLERIDNQYWKIEVSDFQAWFLGFTKLVGEWETKELEENKVLITYTYTLHSGIPILYPFHWLFTKTYWRLYMKKLLENIRVMIANAEPYLYP